METRALRRPPAMGVRHLIGGTIALALLCGVASQASELPDDPFEVLDYRPTGACFALWRQYIAAKTPKAFAITPEKKQLNFYLQPSRYDHYCGFAAAADTPQAAAALAVKYCEDRFVNAHCAVLAADDRIVFTPDSK